MAKKPKTFERGREGYRGWDPPKAKRKKKAKPLSPIVQQENHAMEWSAKARDMSAHEISAELKQVKISFECGPGHWPATLLRIKERCLLTELQRRSQLEEAVMEYEVSAREALKRKDDECAAIRTGRSKPRVHHRRDGGYLEIYVKPADTNTVHKVTAPHADAVFVQRALKLCDDLMGDG